MRTIKLITILVITAIGSSFITKLAVSKTKEPLTVVNKTKKPVVVRGVVIQPGSQATWVK
jgi:hypothetical protein